MPRFVLLRHEMPETSARQTHWDLMLEQSGELRTWALDALPVEGCRIEAVQLPPHRLAYLTCEGEVSGGRGRVVRVDEGTYELHLETPERLLFSLCGRQLCGEAELSPGFDQRWTFAFEPASDVVDAERTSDPSSSC